MTSFLRGAPPPKKNPGSAPAAGLNPIQLFKQENLVRCFTFDAMCMLDFHSDNSEKYECKQALLISFSAESVLHGKTFITELHDMINF